MKIASSTYYVKGAHRMLSIAQRHSIYGSGVMIVSVVVILNTFLKLITICLIVTLH